MPLPCNGLCDCDPIHDVPEANSSETSDTVAPEDAKPQLDIDLAAADGSDPPAEITAEIPPEASSETAAEPELSSPVMSGTSE